MTCLLKYENREYVVAMKKNSDLCDIFKRGSALSPSKGVLINNSQLHVPLSYDILDMFRVKNVYKVDIRKTLKIEQFFKILRFDAEVVSIPFVCKKHFSKRCFTKYVNLNPMINFIKHIRLVPAQDNRNEILEITVDIFGLPKKIKGHKVIKLGEEIIVSTKTIIGDVSKFETKNNLSNTTTRITKRKIEVPYPIKFAAGIVTFLGVLEVGYALISKVVNKIK